MHSTGTCRDEADAHILIVGLALVAGESLLEARDAAGEMRGGYITNKKKTLASKREKERQRERGRGRGREPYLSLNAAIMALSSPAVEEGV